MSIISRILRLLRLEKKTKVLSVTTTPKCMESPMTEFIEWYLKKHTPLTQEQDAVLYKARQLQKREQNDSQISL